MSRKSMPKRVHAFADDVKTYVGKDGSYLLALDDGDLKSIAIHGKGGDIAVLLSHIFEDVGPEVVIAARSLTAGRSCDCDKCRAAAA